MSALAQALVKAGVVSKDDASNLGSKKEDAIRTHRHLSSQISLKMTEKREIVSMRDDLVKIGKEKSLDNTKYVKATHRIQTFLGLNSINLTVAANQRFVLNTFQKKLTELESTIRPMIASCKKIEKEWGLKRN